MCQIIMCHYLYINTGVWSQFLQPCPLVAHSREPSHCRLECTHLPLVVSHVLSSLKKGAPILAQSLLSNLALCFLPSKDIHTKMIFFLNNILRTGNFANTWMMATVIPLYKGGKRNVVSNFRPVSLLPLP